MTPTEAVNRRWRADTQGLEAHVKQVVKRFGVLSDEQVEGVRRALAERDDAEASA